MMKTNNLRTLYGAKSVANTQTASSALIKSSNDNGKFILQLARICAVNVKLVPIPQ